MIDIATRSCSVGKNSDKLASHVKVQKVLTKSLHSFSQRRNLAKMTCLTEHIENLKLSNMSVLGITLDQPSYQSVLKV